MIATASQRGLIPLVMTLDTMKNPARKRRIANMKCIPHVGFLTPPKS
jgi:hypothetical protein